jgi:hypothetical protein
MKVFEIIAILNKRLINVQSTRLIQLFKPRLRRSCNVRKATHKCRSIFRTSWNPGAQSCNSSLLVLDVINKHQRVLLLGI